MFHKICVIIGTFFSEKNSKPAIAKTLRNTKISPKANPKDITTTITNENNDHTESSFEKTWNFAKPITTGHSKLGKL